MALHFCQCAASRILFRLSAQIRAGFLGLGSGRCIGTGLRCYGVGGGVIAFSLVLLTQGRAEDYKSAELIKPPVCSPLKPIPPELNKYCEITQLETDCHPISPGTECHKIKVNLEAKKVDAKEVKGDIGGYTVATEDYNGSYLTPVIEALPGDTVGAYFVNHLPSKILELPLGETHCPPSDAMCILRAKSHGTQEENATNLHYFHGGIVTPRNARPLDAREGTGDNIYVWLKKDKSFELSVPIPGKDQLDARVLEGKEGTYISHPNGLDWYHSHLHGLSSDQVMGGLSGLLSVGEDKAAVKAKCLYITPDQCEELTKELKERTVVRYALLRDISLKKISAAPTEPAQKKTADWAPGEVDFEGVCKVYQTINPGDPGDPDPKLREGYCQRTPQSAWLFPLNGQRYPKITIPGGKNLLLRLGNLSPNVAYWLELTDESCSQHKGCPKDKIIPITLVSLDGVVPARPEDPTQPGIPVEAISLNDLLLMSASRAEIYIRNDDPAGHSDEKVYILRTKGLDTGSDQWPEIQLARIVLEPSKPVPPIALALNVPLEKRLLRAAARVAETMPPGCVGDLNPDIFEHRRVTFDTPTSNGQGNKLGARFKITTEVVHPPGAGESNEVDFVPDTNKTVDAAFEEYMQEEGKLNWDADQKVPPPPGWPGGPYVWPQHPCIHLDHNGSHKQLWVLTNLTGMLHNFHIHQMKFRLATTQELREHRIKPPEDWETCPKQNGQENRPCYKLYEDRQGKEIKQIEWHDTIPVPEDMTKSVFIIMSFDDEKTQIGRFVYHCHILKHEDTGLMAPIEVWGP